MKVSSFETLRRKLAAGLSSETPPNFEASKRLHADALETYAGLSRLVVRLGHDRRGVSAIEFAIVLPLMITMYLGTVEVTQAIDVNRKVTQTARTIADLASQQSTINNADMTNLLKASAAVITPYDGSKLKVTVTRVDIDSAGIAKVVWSDTLGGSKREAGSTVTLPAAFNVANTSLIWSEVAYTYTPAIGYVVTGTLGLTDQLYMRPRLADVVNRVNA